MIKYLGSKRTLVPAIGAIARAVGAKTALDLFTGTTRVAQELKLSGIEVTAVDLASYAAVFARCFIETDARRINPGLLVDALSSLGALPGRRGYVTEVFCERSRYFRPENGARIDAIRDAIEERYAGDPLHPILLTALILAADRVDSTTGLQMAYLKEWAPRAGKPLELKPPTLLPGGGRAVQGDALVLAGRLGEFDLAYLDPPYNQHRYFTNYHVWETLVRWDAPEHYGVACKRSDAREPATRSPFNGKRAMPSALKSVILELRAGTVVVSHNNESWVTADTIRGWLLEAGHEAVERVDVDFRRYVGARIGIYSPSGEKVGKVGRLRNVEHLLIGGAREEAREAARAARSLV